MDLDRRTVVELGIAVLSIVSFTAAAYWVSAEYAAPTNASNGSELPAVEPAGGLALVGAIALFIFVVAGAGLIMYSMDFDDE